MKFHRLHPLIKLVFILSTCFYCMDAIAVMSVDLGGEFMKIAIVKPGVPMEVVLNKESQRKTATIVSMRQGERLVGEPALQLSTRFPANAFKYISTILGKKYSHPYVDLYKKRFPYYQLAENPETGGVVYKLENKEYKPEELVAMILDKAREIAETFVEQPIKDIVVTVPSFFNQAERRAMIRAVSLLEMNLLQLMSVNAAVALNYGVFRRKSFNSTAQVYMFYDMGATSTTASIVSYQVVKMKDRGFMEDNPQLQILGVGFDQTLGSLAFQLRIRDHLAKAFNAKKKTKTDVTGNERSLAKLNKEAGRVLKVLSANSETFAQIEGLIEDIDFRHKVTRLEFEAMCQDLFERVSKPVTDAFLASQVAEVEITEVILMGGCTRIPKVKETLLAVTGKKDLGKSINTDEAAAMGAVYQAAYLSKGYKVKRFGVKEAAIYPIQVWFLGASAVDRGVEFERVRLEEEENTPVPDDKSKIVKRTLFNRMNPFPQKKVMTFNKHTKDFTFQIRYGDLSFLPKDELKAFGDLSLSKVDLSGVTVSYSSNQGALAKGVKAHFKMDESGIISLHQAEAVFEKEQPPEEESTLSKLGSTFSNLFSGDKKEGKEGEGKDEKTEGETKNEDSKKDEKEKKDDTKKESTIKEEKKAEEKVESKQSDKTDKPETNDKTKPNVDESPKTDTENATTTKNTTAQEPAKPKILVIRENVTVAAEIIDAKDPSPDTMKASKSLIDDLRKTEKDKVALEKAKNDLESFILNGREKLYQEEYETCSTEDEREKLRAKFSEQSDWLDEEGYKADIETLNKHLVDLKAEWWDLHDRVREYTNRPHVIDAMKSMLNHTHHFYKSVENLTATDDPVFTKVEITTLSRTINETKSWFMDAWKKLNESDPTKRTPFTKEDFSVKVGVLDREIKYLINKAKNFRPKPKPVPVTNTTTNGTSSTNGTSKSANSTKDGIKLEKVILDAEKGPESEEKKEEIKKEPEETLQLDGDEAAVKIDNDENEAPDIDNEGETKREQTKKDKHIEL